MTEGTDRNEQANPDTGLAALSASTAAARIRDGSLSAERYAGALLAVCRANRDLAAITWVDEQKALEAARAVDVARARGAPPGPLAGVPVIVKDNIDTVGYPTSAATAALKTHFPQANAPVVEALLRHGAVMLAKANMHELAGGGTSSNPVFGAVRNPWDRTRVAGGSSGGTAAAVAARMAPAGLGTDTAGSVRIPSAFCGTVGLRPSIAGNRRYAIEGVVPLALDLDTIGPIARSVADVALLDAAITGDPVPAPASLRGARVGVPRQHYWEALDPQVERVARDALARLREQGAELVDVDVGAWLADADDIFWTLINTGMRGDLAGYFERQGIALQAEAVIDAIASKDTWRLFALAREAPLTAAAIEAARGEGRARTVARYREMFEAQGLTAIAYPTEPLVAPPIAAAGDTFEDEIEVGGRRVSKVEILIRNTRYTCALGTPGLSLPAGLTNQGLPVGLELDGLPGADTALLALGMAAEAAIGPLQREPGERT